MKNQAVSELLSSKGVERLPATVVDGRIALTGRYPTNAEFAELLELPETLLSKSGMPVKGKAAGRKPGDCGCKGGCCG